MLSQSCRSNECRHTFLVSTPGWEASLGGFPALSGAVGQFLLKDVVALGAAIGRWVKLWVASRLPQISRHT